jgi:hypothetical protein
MPSAANDPARTDVESGHVGGQAQVIHADLGLDFAATLALPRGED